MIPTTNPNLLDRMVRHPENVNRIYIMGNKIMVNYSVFQMNSKNREEHILEQEIAVIPIEYKPILADPFIRIKSFRIIDDCLILKMYAGGYIHSIRKEYSNNMANGGYISKRCSSTYR